eukprot:165153-Chlamydomonas_euryale.AAC.4
MPVCRVNATCAQDRRCSRSRDRRASLQGRRADQQRTRALHAAHVTHARVPKLDACPHTHTHTR